MDLVIPVDVYLPGCPPRPEALIDAFRKLQVRIRDRGSATLAPDVVEANRAAARRVVATGTTPAPGYGAGKGDA